MPEIPVDNVDQAVAYYVRNLGFFVDWGGEEGGGIAGISQGHCRLFLTSRGFREIPEGRTVVIWLNLDSIEAVNELHSSWHDSKATIVSQPERKLWKLHELIAADVDGNLFRVFYDFSGDAEAF